MKVFCQLFSILTDGRLSRSNFDVCLDFLDREEIEEMRSWFRNHMAVFKENNNLFTDEQLIELNKLNAKGEEEWKRIEAKRHSQN